MLDLTQIDLQLEQLGRAPDDVQALLERSLGADRSRARVEALLATLAEGGPEPVSEDESPPPRRPSSHPPRALGRHARWAPPPQAAVPKVPSVRDTLIGPTVEPEHAAAKPAEPAQMAAPSHESADAAAFRPDDAGDSSGNDDTQPSYSHEAHEAMDEAAAGAQQSAQAAPIDPETAAREHRSQMKKLLEQDLDPNDFQREPNPPESQSAAGDELELLIEDDELLEIADDDLEIIDEEQ